MYGKVRIPDAEYPGFKIKMEEQRKAEYGLANARLRKEEDKLRELIIRKAGYEKQARELVQGTIDVHKIHTCSMRSMQ